MNIREIEAEAFKQIHQNYVMIMFPRNEIRRYSGLKKLMKRGCYFVWILEKAGELIGFAAVLRDPKQNIGILDLFAILPKHQQDGYGSYFLQRLHKEENLPNLLIECEYPTDESKQKRIDFYEKNGAQRSPYDWRSFGVKYEVLYLTKDEMSRDDKIVERITDVYALTLPPLLIRLLTHLKKRS